MLKKVLVLAILVCLPTAALAKSPDKDRAEILEMRQKVLAQLYIDKPGSEAEVAGSKGYAVFNNRGINLFLVSSGSGKGVTRLNGTGKDVYMKMYSAGVGIGAGVKKFSAVFIFHTQEALDQFVEEGWDMSGQTDAAADTGKDGGSAGGGVDIGSGVTVYQMTDAGLALQATLQGTKYWQDGDLN
jgi:lipid-binding SYLF domain-containing protein